MADNLVLVCSSRDKSIGIGRLGGDGRVTAMRQMPFPEVTGDSGACPMTVSPDGRRLYLAFRGTPFAVLSFAIDAAGGTLDYLGTAPLPESMAYIATDRTGRYLFAASYGAGAFSVNSIDAKGVAGPTLDAFAIGEKAHCALVSPDNRFVLVPSLGLDQVVRVGFEPASGKVERLAQPAVQLPKGTGPRHLVLHPNGRFGYLVGELNGSVTALAIGPDMAMTPIGTHSILAPGYNGVPQSADIHLTPDGLLLYTSDRGSDYIAGFKVDAETGRLTPAGGIAAPKTPRGFAISPDGRFLLSLGETSDTLTSFAIDPKSGALSQLAEQKIGAGPNWIEIVPA